MADRRIIFEIDADTGDLVKVEQQAKKTKKAIGGTADSYDKAAKGANKYHKQEKGVASAGANTTKNFSKMKQTMGAGSSGLVGAYATLAANVFAATAAFTALRAGAQTQQLVQGLEAVGEASGRNLGALAQRVREAADGALSLDQALRTAATGASANFDDSQLLGLTRVAKGAALALGRDVGDAQDRLVRGAAKLEPEILDELGIFVRLDDAAEKYAAAIGKTASELTRFQKGQAFTNEIITQGTTKFSEIADAVDPNPYDKLAATLTDLSRNFLNLINSVLGPFASLLANNQVLLAGLFAMITKGVISQALPALTKMGQKMKGLSAQILGAAEAEERANQKTINSIIKKTKTLGPGFSAYDRLIQKMKTEELTIDEIREAQRLLHEYVKKNSKSQKGFIQERVNLARQEKIEIDNLLASRIKLAQATPVRQRAASLGASFETTGGDILSGLDEPGKGGFAGYKEAFAQSKEAGAKFRKDMELTNKKIVSADKLAGKFGKRTGFVSKQMAKFSLVARRGGAAFASFGLTGKIAIKGLFTAIPFIGQVLFALDLFVIAIKKALSFLTLIIPEQGALAKASDAVTSSMENLESATDRNNLSSKNFADKITISSTATEQLITDLEAQAKAQLEVSKNTGILSATMAKLTNFFTNMGRTIVRMWNNLGDVIKRRILNIKLQIAEFMQSMLTMRVVIAEIMNIGKQRGDVGFIDTDAMVKDTFDAVSAAQLAVNAFAEETKRKMTGISRDIVSGLDQASLSSIAAMEELLKGTGAASEELRQKLQLTSGTGINEFIARMDEAGGILEALSPELREAALKQLELGDIALKTASKAQILNAVLKAGTLDTKENSDAAKGLTSVFENEKIKIDKFMTSLAPRGATASVATTFKEIHDSVKLLVDGGELAAASVLLEQMGQGAETLIKGGIGKGLFDTMKTDIEEAEKKLSEIEDTTSGRYLRAELRLKGLREEQTKILNGQVDIINTLLQKQAKSEIFDKARLANLKRQSAALKKSGKDNAAGVAANIAITNKSINIELDALDTKIKLQKRAIGMSEEEFALAVEAGEQTETQVQIKAGLGDLEEKRLTLQEKIIGTEEKSALIQQATLKRRKEESKLLKAQQEGQLKILKIQTRIENIGKGRGASLNKRQEFEFAQKTAQIAIDAAKRELKLMQAKFELEKLILRARLLAAGVEAEGEGGVNDILSKMQANFEVTKKISAEKIKQMENEKRFAGLDFGGGTVGVTSVGGNALQALRDNLEVGGQTTNAISEFFKDQLENAELPTNAEQKMLEMADKLRAKVAFEASQFDLFGIGTGGKYSDIAKALDLEEAAGQSKQERKDFIISEEQAATFQARLSMMNQAVQPMLASLRELGPEGELAASVGQGMFTMVGAIHTFAEAGESTADKLAAVATAISSISSIMAASGKAAIAAIDKQIAAEKARDGKSAESVNKLKALEAKKDAMARKNF